MKKRYQLILIALVLVICTLCFVGCVGQNSTEYDTIKLTKMNNYELLNKNAENNQVVFIGDSIVELFPTYELFATHHKIVYNKGISGDTSDRMLERLEKNALNINPEVVCILIGTNDIARDIEHSMIIDNISKSIDKCKENGVKRIIINGLLPVHKNIDKNMVGKRTNKEIKELNQKLSSLAVSKDVLFVDFSNALVDDEGNFDKELTYDGLHPNALGYFAMAKVLESLLVV